MDPESGGEQGESGAAAVGAFSGFFSGLATAVEQRVSDNEQSYVHNIHFFCYIIYMYVCVCQT